MIPMGPFQLRIFSVNIPPELLQNNTTLQKVGKGGPKPAGTAGMLLKDKNKFSCTATLLDSPWFDQLVSNLTFLQFPCTEAAGQDLGSKHTWAKAPLTGTAKQIWVCAAAGPSTWGREAAPKAPAWEQLGFASARVPTVIPSAFQPWQSLATNPSFSS